MAKELKKICCIFNYAPHYRKQIFLLMEKQLDCDFYFGEKTYTKIKKIDYTLFNKTPKELKHNSFAGYYFLWGSVRLCFKSYNTYILTGEPSSLSSWIVAIICKILNKRVFFWSHGRFVNDRRIERSLKRNYFKLADGVFLYGNYAKEQMLMEGFKTENLHVIYNSLEYDLQLSVRKRLQQTTIYYDYFKNNDPVLIFIGRIEASKKLHYLLEVQKRLINNNINVNVVFVGDGGDSERLLSIISDYDLIENTWFFGGCYDEHKIGELLYNAQLCISPGSIGLTAIHSLAYGTPIISHNNFKNQGPEFEAITPGITGDFFIEDRIDSLFNSIRNWLKLNPEKTDLLIKQCNTIIDEKYNPRYQMKVLMDTLE